MARTISEIKAAMTQQWMSNTVVRDLYGINPNDIRTFEQQFSRTSIESIWFYIVAFAHWTIEKLFDTHTAEMDEKIRTQRNHTIEWYRSTALNFQYSREFSPQLLPDITEYDNSNFTEDEIAQRRIKTKCSVTVAQTDKPVLIIKVQKAGGKLSAGELEAFRAYMSAKADAGVTVSAVSEDADRLVLYLIIRRDQMVLDANGNRFSDGGNTLVESVQAHLNNLIFNGVFYPSRLEQYLMQQPGIRVATVTASLAGIGTPTAFTDKYAPYSGAITADGADIHAVYEVF